MKGNPKPTWTAGRHAWLTQLKQQGRGRPRGTGQGSVATYCRALGWTHLVPPHGHVLTAAGITMLAKWDAGDTVPPKLEAVTVDLARIEPAELASRLVAIGTDLAKAVRDRLTDYLDAADAPRFHPGGVVDGPMAKADEVAAIVSASRDVPREQLVAPQYGIRRPLCASMGTTTRPSGYTECLCCRGRGTVGHNFQCVPCGGTGRIQRTVEL